MDLMASLITSLTVVYSIVYSDTDQRKHQSSASLAFVREFTGDRWIPRTKASDAEPVTRKMFPFDDVIMGYWCPGSFPRKITTVVLDILEKLLMVSKQD